jgi:hypothetical protein
MHPQYKYENADCADCLDLQSEPCCPHRICPYIMNNLEDLARDVAFRTAINDAEFCGTYHRATLLYLRGDTPCPV